MRHRIGEPAVEYVDGFKSYWFEGKRHREDGPAIEFTNGRKEYYFEGKLHRTDGPAIIHANGNKEYYIDGVKVEPFRSANDIISEISKLLDELADFGKSLQN